MMISQFRTRCELCLRYLLVGEAFWVLAGALGCAGGAGGDIYSNAQDRFGRTYYIDGAGNWGFGVSSVTDGLRKAGYRGNIINYRWSPTFNPALDQTVGRPVARAKGKDLGEQITAYLRKYPEADVNLIALSAGTGVAVWACENIEPPAKVKSVILLGSSLSSDYNMTLALRNIENGVYVYHSRADMILQGPVRTLGTIDGKIGVEPAGIVGLRGGLKIHNTPWSPRYERYGWTGSHTDATSSPFVRHVLAQHVVSSDAAQGRNRIVEPVDHVRLARGGMFTEP
jgi:hypothetical protein